MKILDIDIINRITRIRHEMHISQDCHKWIELLTELQELMQEIAEKGKIKSIKLPSVYHEDCYCNEEYCTEDDDCEYCKDKEYEVLHKNKEEVNSIIEDYLQYIEDKYNMERYEIAPSGQARYDWVMRG